MSGAALEQRVERAAAAAFAQRRYVTAIDVLLGLGWLTAPHLDDWRQGRVQCLERVVQARPTQAFQGHARVPPLGAGPWPGAP